MATVAATATRQSATYLWSTTRSSRTGTPSLQSGMADGPSQPQLARQPPGLYADDILEIVWILLTRIGKPGPGY
jgi:hypothetical protein